MSQVLSRVQGIGSSTQAMRAVWRYVADKSSWPGRVLGDRRWLR
jgi:hypothetical protein